MDISFDPVKNDKNIRELSLAFEQVAQFDFQNALFLIDNRQNYGETRYIAVGYLEKR